MIVGQEYIYHIYQNLLLISFMLVIAKHPIDKGVDGL